MSDNPESSSQLPPDSQKSQHDKALQEELQSYAAALRAEFAESQSSQSPADVEKHTREFFKRNVQDAALQIVWLAHNSDSDSIRLRASTFIVKEAFDEAAREGDPIRDLMRELTAKPAHPQTSQEKLEGHMARVREEERARATE